MKKLSAAVSFVAICLLVTAAAADTTTVGFDGGSNDGFTGNAFYESSGGNPGGNAHVFGEFFFPVIRTGGLGEPVNPAFVGDFSGLGPITFEFDILTDSLTDFNGDQIARPFGIMLVDRDIQGGSGSSGVFYEAVVLSSAGQDDWTHFSVTISDPTSTSLPPGWIGFGDEDPNTFEPILPGGASFATVLAGVDEFHLTGAVPGFFFTFANFDFRIDNVSITTASAVPEPTSAGLLLLSGLAGMARRRSRRSRLN